MTISHREPTIRIKQWKIYELEMDILEFQEHTMKVKIIREFFYSEESYFGMYACVPIVKSEKEKVQLNDFNNFSLRGTTRPLKVGSEYIVTFDGLYPNKNPKFDDYYEIKQVEPEKLSSKDDQDRFLQAVITERQFNILKEAYPNELLVDLILEDKINTKKTKGIKKASLAKIKEQVQLNSEVALLIAKLDTLSLSTNSISRIMKHFQSGQRALDAINKNIYSLCDVKGYGFLTVDKVALRSGINLNSSKRVQACIKHVLKEDSQSGHTWMSKDDFFKQTEELLQVDANIISNELNAMSSLEIYVDDNRIALAKIRHQELAIHNNLERIHSTYVPLSDLVEERLNMFEMGIGFTLSKKQRETILKSYKNGVSIINGGAGSGKTAIVKAIIETSGMAENEIMTCALSGKASNVLSSRGMPSATIHRLLGYNGEEFKYSQENPLPYELIIVDESSMVDISIFLSLLQAIKTGSRLVIVGDSFQLSCVGYGDILQNLIETSKFDSFELKQIFRQGANSGVLELATKIRNEEYSIPYNSTGKQSFGSNGEQAVITYSSEEKESIMYDALKIIGNMKETLDDENELLDFQVLVPNRESGRLSAKNMNIAIQEILNDMSKPHISRGGYDYREGDKVIANGNVYEEILHESVESYYESVKKKEMEEIFSMELDEDSEVIEPVYKREDVFNGTLGIIKHVDVDEKLVFVQFENIGGLVVYKSVDLDKISLAYAITIHRSQGSQYSRVLICLDFSSYMLLTMNLVYTAITRSSDKCVLLAENNALSMALTKKSNTRRTFLKELLSEVK